MGILGGKGKGRNKEKVELQEEVGTDERGRQWR